MPSGPLSGVRVLEFTQIIAGPFGCMMLADLGAEVIKVEPPGGEPWRQFSQFLPGEAKTFQSMNRGKRSLVLELGDPKAQEIVHRLVPKMDVVVSNYRPDVPARLGIDYETLRALKPDLIYIDNTAFGRRGPRATRPGYDIVVQAVTGLMAGEGKVDASGAPMQISSTAIADFGTGLAIAWAASTALYHRERTGEGQFIETSLLATALAFQGGSVMEHPMADAAARNPMRERRRQLAAEHAPYPELLAARNPLATYPGNIFYRPYATKDGALAIGALSAGLRAKVRVALETDFLGQDDPEFDPRNPEFVAKAQAAVDAAEALVATRTTAEWMAIFEREGVPAGPVQFPEDMSTDAQVLANEMIVHLEHDLSGPQEMVAPILKFSATPAIADEASPPLGRDTETYLREAGYSDADIEELRGSGVIA